MYSKPSSSFAKPCWNTSTRTPYAAATDSRFSTIVFSAMTTERKATSMSRNASPSTNANTSGALPRTASLKSFEPAVSPVTPASTPSIPPTVAGTISFRSVASAS